MLGIIMLIQMIDYQENHKILLKRVKILMIYQKFKRMGSKCDIQHNPNIFEMGRMEK